MLNLLGNQNPALPGLEDTRGMNLPRELQNAGRFTGQMTNQGSVSTIIPATEVKTEFFTETCDDGITNQCYQTAATGRDCWCMSGDINCESSTTGSCNCNCCDNHSDCGYRDRFRKQCGNTSVLPDIEQVRIDGGAAGTVADDQIWIPGFDGLPVLVNTDYLIIEDDLGE